MKCPHCNYIIPKYEYQLKYVDYSDEDYSDEERQMYKDYEEYGEFFTASNIILRRETGGGKYRDEPKMTEIIGCPKCKMIFIDYQ